jgi:hypothetical protein
MKVCNMEFSLILCHLIWYEADIHVHATDTRCASIHCSQHSLHRLIWATLRAWYRFQDGHSLHTRRRKNPISGCSVFLVAATSGENSAFSCVAGDSPPSGDSKQQDAESLHCAYSNMEAAATSLAGQLWSTCDTYRIDYWYITNVKQVILLNLNADNKCCRRYRSICVSIKHKILLNVNKQNKYHLDT